MSTAKVFAGVASVAAIFCLGVAVYQLQAVRTERTALAELNRQQDLETGQLRRLEKAVVGQASSSTTTAAKETGPEQAAADEARRIAKTPANGAGSDAKAAAAARRQAARANAKSFLTQYPQARDLLVGFMTKNMQNYYAPFFHAAGLSQTQIDDFIAQTAQLHIDTLQMGASGGWTIGQQNLPADTARSILGDAGYQQWQQAIQTMPAENWSEGLAIAVKNGTTPLSSDQVTELTQVLASNSPDYASGNRVKLQTVDWASAMEQAQGLMTDAQWQQAQTYLTLQAANRQLQALVKGSK